MDTNTGTPATQKKSFTRFFPHIARILLGLAFLIFGLNGFLNFMPAPKNLPEPMVTVSMGLMRGGYMQVVSGAEILIALMLLINRFVPLALAFLAPIIVGILTFHVATSPQMIGPGIVVLLLELYLAWSYRKAFRPMLAARHTPGQRCE
ncbi:MAG TPA: DoxX family protein [Candidatus Angelobacter sp.]|nr:DoxX family protein [Candidatus Angelobacter sp.]